MFCYKCGKQIADGKKFCPYCGANQSGEPNPLMQGGIASQPVGGTAPNSQNNLQKKPDNPKRPLKIDSALIFSLCEIIILAVIIFAFIKVGNYMYGPASIAKSYMRAIAEDDWDTVYTLTDTGDFDDVDKSEISKAVSNMIPGDFDSYEVSVKDSDDDDCQVRVRYGSDGSLKNKVTLSMSRQSAKQFLVFRTWKVSVDNELVNNLVVYAPVGTTAYFDGKELSRDLIQEGYAPSDYDDYMAYDAYVIPETYQGKHNAAAAISGNVVAYSEADIRKNSSDDENDSQESDEADEIILSSVFAPADLQNEIINTAYSDFQAEISAKVTGSGFDSIKDIYGGAQDQLSGSKEKYENAADYYYKTNSEGVGIKNIRVHDVNGTMNNFYADEDSFHAEIDIEFKYDYKNVESDWWTGNKTENEYDNNSGSCMIYLQMDKDGSWKVISEDMYNSL